MNSPNYQSLVWAHPLVQDWFIQKVGKPTEPQEQGWPFILAGNDTLISSPTGSGKTLAAFLACLDGLVRKAVSGNLLDMTEVLYVSPLKALSNDVQKNLLIPLEEITELARERGMHLPEIRVAVRTGDTPTGERQKMLKQPPHILITTPESFYILLTAEKSRINLASIHTVIVDEIHALANNKRGTHLALSLERLEALTLKPFIRIGLSATQKPLEKVAHFLTGAKKTKVKLVNIGHARQLDLQVVVPDSELAAVASNEMWDEIYEKIAAFARENRSTLVFVNTRKLAERVAHHLEQRLGEDKVLAHHGSLSRKLRLEAETKLKKGELQILVATASLELGIDIGSIDLVCQIGSPRAIATALQRIGRAGHWHAAISKGRIFATTRDELLECAALVYAIREGDLDQLIIPQEPLDILAQQIVAACATQDWEENALFHHFKNAYPYQHLTREKFNEILTMLSEGIAGSRGRYGSYIHRDQVNHVIKARRGSRLAAITSGGAIPDNGLFTVIALPDNAMVGTLDEDFAVESNRGDIFLLGTNSWKILRIENGRVLVEDAHGAPPSVPFWLGEAPARSIELSLQVSQLREKIDALLPEKSPQIVDIKQYPEIKAAIQWLMSHCGLDHSAAEQLLEYVRLGRQILGAVPTQKTVIAERFFDESGGMQLIIHAPFGARINKAWGLALRKKFCRSFNFELQAAATDNGLNIALAEQHSFPLSDVFHFLHTNTLKEVVIQAVLQSPFLGVRFRAVAARSLSLLRFRGGKKIPPNIQRMLADDLLAAVFPDAAACQDNLGGRDVLLPEHPLIEETMKDILTEALDIDGFAEVIHAIESKHITCLAVDTPVPSVFSHEILNANPYAFLDDAPLEERRSRAVEMRRVLPEALLEEVGKLDPKAITEVQEQAWPDIRSADELHDVLHTVIVFPETIHVSEYQSTLPIWKHYFIELQREGRAALATVAGTNYYVSAEKKKTFHCIFPQATFANEMVDIEEEPNSQDEGILKALRGWLLHTGPITQKVLTGCLQLSSLDVEHALLKLEASGYLLRGNFRAEYVDEIEWCERRLLARIHRYTTESLRKQIKPVTRAQFMAWLLKWQHVTKGNQMHGESGLLEVIKQLQGFELAANAWESDIFPARVHDYDLLMLDKLCMSGLVGWGRVSPHPSVIVNEDEAKKSRRLSPTRNAPITFFVREESDWIPPHALVDNIEEVNSLSHPARNIYQFLQKYGASFYADIVRGTGNLKVEVENGLWELVAAGMVTADSFDNVRTLMSTKRKYHSRHRRRPLFPLSTGRWSLLHVHAQADHEKRVEAACWMLLKRYGVVFRDLLAREKNIPRWRDLLIFLRRLELRGEVRGGRFVDGFLGEQFALPYAVDSLRAMRNEELDEVPQTISSVDPLNLIGIVLPGERVSAAIKSEIRLIGGQVASQV
ncbi:DEAD/DEAH box helicase [Legionella anisa]|uniref:DEAD/DEAH box helicase n=1 Tax=Legionella anisa TaxID=28082 RepID=A0AAX0WWB1_9GAMM|nr:DEAD/DEAH box helicase [Legionella anisa]AWN73645.1 DEAD/DEAH box helicase [Legionella anisa]KTC75761.1 helicase, DEAD/DEAH box family [Legionella anisa]MBN5935601.1 DEAD/DEAH box helicase [Legionella anisa]MCW8426538.1 DEAD/DEAH box helicase [Legionella anisa]MCW8448201.1 DEAD/DEAH box helicase [Legionella anisa]